MTQQIKNIKSSYGLYKKTCENIVDIKTYIKISTLYIKFIIGKVILGDEVVLPARLGTIHITGTIQIPKYVDGELHGISPNWKKTKELWETCQDCKDKKQLVYNTNEHSDGIRYKFIWSKRKAYVQHKSLYSLRMTRDNKRSLYSAIINGQEY